MEDQEDAWQALAKKNWLKAKPNKLRADLVKKEIWDVLEKSNFDYNDLRTLEGLRLLEYLWTAYTDDAVDAHALIIILLVTVRIRESLSPWTVFGSDSTRFSSIFRRAVSSSLNTSQPLVIRTYILRFIIGAFQSLDFGIVRKECAPLVSISIWSHLASDQARNARFAANPQIGKVWRASERRYAAVDEAQQAKMRFDRAWLVTLLTDFLGKINDESCTDVLYCELFLEFLSDLESQLPTRRYVNALLHDFNLLVLVPRSPLFNVPQNALFRDLFHLLQHYMTFPVDDHSGQQLSPEALAERSAQHMAHLQRTALQNHKEKLTMLALSHHAAIGDRAELKGHLDTLSDEEIASFCSSLYIRVHYPKAASVSEGRGLNEEALIAKYAARPSFQDSVDALSTLPTEKNLYEESLLRNETYDGSRPLAIPKINLQYLTITDFLWRSFVLHRCEQFFEIRNYLEDVVARLQPKQGDNGIRLAGFSKMALPIPRPAILEAAEPRIGCVEPAFVRAEISFNVNRVQSENVRNDWLSLQPGDTLFLLGIDIPSPDLRNGSDPLRPGAKQPSDRLAQISTMRVAEVVHLQDAAGRSLGHNRVNGEVQNGQLTRMLVNLDARAYAMDMERKAKDNIDVYEKLTILVRRNKRENNFKKILETIKHLTITGALVPAWLKEVFLGYGDPNSAHHRNLANKLASLDMRDTFVDWDHVVASFPNSKITTKKKPQGPPYVLEPCADQAPTPASQSRKRRRSEPEAPPNTQSTIAVSSHDVPSSGPYPQNAPKLNKIAFTPKQVEAIASGLQPGLTVIVGPPGTGKTDVTTQIISNIYHDFPMERTLLIAHSNQALNQLFQKITCLDIDVRHLLRLGQGEGELDTGERFSKLGRVESFLDNRSHYLGEVDRLAQNVHAPGAHGSTCETAEYFRAVYIAPAWSKFWTVASSKATIQDIVTAFPFHEYFSTAPQPLFPEKTNKATVLDIIRGCERHIEKIFTELADIRPFEILRSSRERSNYLMVKEARIIAMTSTHAAMRRQEFADLGFQYDNVVMEEAAQITEVENFIPLVLQQTKNDVSRLKRVVLCGDHLQNSPIISNMAFRQFANLEQSLFLRLIRLGVPVVNLDAQGRARPSIAELYRWRYEKLDNLPNVTTEEEYRLANAGFAHEYQFINVDDYKGQGETRPTSHFLQNLGEAEYAVALYQYMRLLGYPARKISILTTYAGQRALIRDVLMHRCSRNRLFGMPRIVATVDKYQGEQNDYIILSLVRTTRPGYLRDLRRLTVALSRARLGLYILGRRSVFEDSAEFQSAFALPFARPAKLSLVLNEMYPAARLLSEKADETAEMANVEHIGQYVFEMTRAKMEMLKQGQANLPEEPEPEHELDDEDDLDEIDGASEKAPEEEAEAQEADEERVLDPVDS